MMRTGDKTHAHGREHAFTPTMRARTHTCKGTYTHTTTPNRRHLRLDIRAQTYARE